MISASITTYSHYNLKILRPKVTKNIKNLSKKFCEFPPRSLRTININECFYIVDTYRKQIVFEIKYFNPIGLSKAFIHTRHFGTQYFEKKIFG